MGLAVPAAASPTFSNARSPAAPNASNRRMISLMPSSLTSPTKVSSATLAFPSHSRLKVPLEASCRLANDLQHAKLFRNDHPLFKEILRLACGARQQQRCLARPIDAEQTARIVAREESLRHASETQR